MIKQALEYLADELKLVLGLNEDDISLNSLAVLQEKKEQGLLVSLISIEEEGTLKNSPHYHVHEKKAFYQASPLSLNLQLSLVFDFDDYGTSLDYLSAVANFFHKKNSFSAEKQVDDNPFPIEQLGSQARIIVDSLELNLEQLNHVWNMCGGVHHLALFYKIRLLQLEQDDATEVNNIESIDVDSRSFKSTAEMHKALKEKQQNL